MNSVPINDGGPAFPYLTASERDREVTTHEGEHGMSLRDYFAAKAMQELLSLYVERDTIFADHVATLAYQAADAMLKARSA